MSVRLVLPTLLTLSLPALSCSSDEGGTPPPSPEVCLNISGALDAGGLSIRKPEEAVNGCTGVPGSTEESRICRQKAPDLSCVGQAAPVRAPLSVTFVGCVSSFGLEAQSDDLTVTVLRERGAGGAPNDPGYDHAGLPGRQAENTPAAVLGQSLSTRVEASRCADLGYFKLENIPTETPLIVRVTDQHLESSVRAYVDVYKYNVILRNAAIRSGEAPDSPLVQDPETYCAANPCFVIDEVNTVYRTTFTTVALTAGVSQIEGADDLYDGVGQGHIAGEVQDCTSEDSVKNAVVALSRKAKKLAYFNVDYPPSLGNLEDPKVDQSRSRTNGDGLYAAIAVDSAPGGEPVDIGAAVTPSICGADGVCRCTDGKANPAYTAADQGEGEVLLLGKRTIYVFPDSITIMTFDRELYTSP
jgi:hypothetical protein